MRPFPSRRHRVRFEVAAVAERGVRAGMREWERSVILEFSLGSNFAVLLSSLGEVLKIAEAYEHVTARPYSQSLTNDLLKQ